MANQVAVAPPSEDKRWKIVEVAMRRNGFRSDAVIESLHKIQEAFGFLEPDALLYVAQSLNVAPSKVYGVATFYHFFQMRPQGEHVCSVCTGTACHIKGGKLLLDHMKETYGLRPGETTSDGALSLLTVRCIGACGLAPAVVIDGDVAGNVSNASLDARLGGLITP